MPILTAPLPATNNQILHGKKKEAEIAHEHQKSFAQVEVNACLTVPDIATVLCRKGFLTGLIPA